MAEMPFLFVCLFFNSLSYVASLRPLGPLGIFFFFKGNLYISDVGFELTVPRSRVACSGRLGGSVG